MQHFINYIKLSRPDHWVKNLLLLPGMIMALVFFPVFHGWFIGKLVIALLSASLISAANYILNGWLDREYDQFHPIKQKRLVLLQPLTERGIWVEYIIFSACGFGLAVFLGPEYFFASLMLWIMGILYNVKPIRTKDIPYLDTLTEAFNNPIRFVMGWSLVSKLIPSISLLLSYWMAGAFIMGMKRYSEYQFINNPQTASRYRQSFKYYNPARLLVSSMLYALLGVSFLAIFATHYMNWLSLLLPFYCILLSWYLAIGLEPNSLAQYPEKIYKARGFFAYLLLIITATLFVLFVPDLSLKRMT